MRANLVQANSKKIPLADKTVQTCVTSPPYYGLRDYGTAEWVGGDPECDHKVGRFEHGGVTEKQSSNSGSAGHQARDICPKCGATRVDAQLGLEPTLAEYIENMCQVFDEVWRVLRDDGTCWVNMGDSYATTPNGRSAADVKAIGKDDRTFRDLPMNTIKGSGLKPKDLMGVPWRLAFALQERGWWLRSALPWIKRNSMPESADDRPNTSVEYFFLLTKKARYYFDMEAVRYQGGPGWCGSSFVDERDKKTKPGLGMGERSEKPGRNWRNSDMFFASLRSILDGGQMMLCDNEPLAFVVNTKGYPGSHFATFPPDLIEPCILAGTSEKGGCPECGAPWERETDVEYKRHRKAINRTSPREHSSYIASRGEVLNKHVTTTGWRPTCSCMPSPGENCIACIGECDCTGNELLYRTKPQIVLDPFGGSGTTAQVAQAHGRIGVCLDLSWEYLMLAQERCGIKQMREWTNGKKSVEANLEGLPMFSERIKDGTIPT